jgi:L-asparaginase
VEPIRIIITGGTFDKQYDEIRGELTFRTTHLPQILERVRVTVPVELEIERLIDSLEMDDSVRGELVSSCAEAKERQIIVTHGTDTLTETARLIAEARLDKTIVLTGAMVPFAFTGSDAEFNLGCAVAAVQILDPGVYVAMNGRIFREGTVEKNRERGVFEEPT